MRKSVKEAPRYTEDFAELKEALRRIAKRLKVRKPVLGPGTYPSFAGDASLALADERLRIVSVKRRVILCTTSLIDPSQELDVTVFRQKFLPVVEEELLKWEAKTGIGVNLVVDETGHQGEWHLEQAWGFY